MKARNKTPRVAPGKARDVFKLTRADLPAIEENGALLTNKDIARATQLHVRSVKRWWKRLNVPPFINRNGTHRWTYRQAKIFLERWQQYRATHAITRNWRNGRASAPK